MCRFFLKTVGKNETNMYHMHIVFFKKERKQHQEDSEKNTSLKMSYQRPQKKMTVNWNP